MKSHFEKDNPNLHYLDPNVSFILLADDANLSSYGGCEIGFRSQLEATINDYKKVPVVVIVIEGGPSVVWSCLKSVQNNIPCVFINVSMISDN